MTIASKYSTLAERNTFRKQQESLIARLKAEKAKHELNLDEIAVNASKLVKKKPGNRQAKINEIDLKIEQVTNATTKAELPTGPPGAMDMFIAASVITGGLTIIFCACFSFFGAIASTAEDSNAIGRAIMNLKDPGSMQVTGVRKNGDKVTVKYRAKNSFGAYINESQTFDR